MKYLDKGKPRERTALTTRVVDRSYSTRRHRRLSELIREHSFWSVWKHGDDNELYYTVRGIIKDLNTLEGHEQPMMSRQEFDEALKHVNPKHPSYMQARHEFWRLIVGDYRKDK